MLWTSSSLHSSSLRRKVWAQILPQKHAGPDLIDSGRSLEEMSEIFGDEIDINTVRDHSEDEKLETDKL